VHRALLLSKPVPEIKKAHTATCMGSILRSYIALIHAFAYHMLLPKAA